MAMEDLVLTRLVQELKAPIASLQAKVEQQANELLRRGAELERLRKAERDFTSAQLAFTDLHRAADRVVKSNGVARRKALTELKAAMAFAEKHIDWVPF